MDDDEAGAPVSYWPHEKIAEVWRSSHAVSFLHIYGEDKDFVAKGAGMKRFSDNPSAEDRRTYRRWVGGLYLFYSAALVVAMGITFMNQPASELRASNQTQTARLNATAGSTTIAPAERLVAKP